MEWASLALIEANTWRESKLLVPLLDASENYFWSENPYTLHVHCAHLVLSQVGVLQQIKVSSHQKTCSLSGNFSFLGGPLLLPSQTSCSSPPEIKILRKQDLSKYFKKNQGYLILKAPLRGLLGLVAVSTPGNEEAKKSRYSCAILLNFYIKDRC